MRIDGAVILGGTPYLASRLESKDEITWYIFNYQQEIDGTMCQLPIQSLFANKIKDIQPFLVSAQTLSVNSHKVWGNPNLINRLVTAFNEVSALNFDNVDETKEEVENGIIFTTTKTSNNGAFLKISNLYTEYLSNTKRELSEEEQNGTTNIFTNIKETITDKLHQLVKNKTTMYSLDFKYRDVEFKTMNVNMKSTKRIPIELQELNIFDQAKERDLREAILATKAKSLAQLRLDHDLSWYYNPDGTSKKDYQIVDTIEKLEWYCKNVFPHVKLWSVDIEATGLNMFVGEDSDLFDHTVSIMLSWKKDQAIFIPINMAYMKNIPKTWVKHLKYWLEKIPACGHNIGFDARGLYSDFGIKLNVKFDTQILNFNINCHRAKFKNSLKYLEHKHFKVDTLELKDIFGTSKLAGLFRYLPKELALIYACPDVDMDLQLLYLLWDMLPVACRPSFERDMRALRHTWQLDCIGNKVDTEEAKLYRKANNKDRALIQSLANKWVGQKLMFMDKVSEIQYLRNKGLISFEDGVRELELFEKSEAYKTASYKVDMNSNKKLADLMFNKLDMPPQGRSKKPPFEPSVDAASLKKLMDIKLEQPSDWLRKDIKSYMTEVGHEDIVLIDKDEFNSMMYPLALLIVEYRLRDKRDSTFFKQLLDTAVGGRYYTSSKLASAETFRIINTVQTLQGYMKKLIIPYDKDHYLLVFDFSQIEYRYMAGAAKVKFLIEKLNNLRADFHRECCSLLHNKEPWLITSKQRKDGKSLNFAIPYGMGLVSICIQLFKEVTKLNMIEAQKQLNRWLEKFHLISEMLEHHRDFAMEHGYVENENCRRRYFCDEDADETGEIPKSKLNLWRGNMKSGTEASIRRAAGNFPIQSGAADYFKDAFCNFRERLEREGLADKVKTTALIHDEMVSSVHKSVNPYYLYKLICEECMIDLPGHPKYYAGISVCNNWYEGKDDLFEAPMEFVMSKINSPDSESKYVDEEDAKNVPEKVLNDIEEYMDKTFIKEFGECGIDLEKDVLNLKKLMSVLEDYFLRDKITVYHELPKWKRDKAQKKGGQLPDDLANTLSKYEDDRFVRSFEQFVLAQGLKDRYTIIYPDNYPLGTIGSITKTSRTFFDSEGKVLFNLKYKDPKEEEFKTDEFNSEVKGEEVRFDVSDLFADIGDVVDNATDIDASIDEDDFQDLFEMDTHHKDEDENIGTEDSRIDQLLIYESMESDEEGVIDYSSLYLFTNVKDSREDEDEEVQRNPDKYIKSITTYKSDVRLTSDYIYINLSGIPIAEREPVEELINSWAVSPDTLGAVEVVIALGHSYDETGVYIKDYDLAQLKELVATLKLKQQAKTK